MSKKGILTISALVAVGISTVYFLDFKNSKNLLGSITSPISKQTEDISQTVDNLNAEVVDDFNQDLGDGDQQIATNFGDLKDNLSQEIDLVKNKGTLFYQKGEDQIIRTGKETRKNATDIIDTFTNRIRKRYENILVNEVCKNLEN